MNAILVINTGSSSIKFSIFLVVNKQISRKFEGFVDNIAQAPKIKIRDVGNKILDEVVLPAAKQIETNYRRAIKYILNWVQSQNINLVAAGHRVVHGGSVYSSAIKITEKVFKDLKEFVSLAPLHQPYNLKGIALLQEQLPGLTQIACFDTAFHTTCNPISQHYPLPQRFTEAGIKRYGFHGLSYEYIASELPELMSAKEANGRFIVAHLGNGATMCAIKNRKSVATSIGFTAVDGLPMGTRCGSIDPGLVLHMMQAYKLNKKQMQDILYKESGLLGVSGYSSDMRELLASKKTKSKLAVDIFVHRITLFAGQLTAELQGLDGFIFTGGIGQNAAPIREMVCEKLSWLGIKLDKIKNSKPIKAPTKISARSSKVQVWAMPTDEELMIAKHTFSGA